MTLLPQIEALALVNELIFIHFQRSDLSLIITVYLMTLLYRFHQYFFFFQFIALTNAVSGRTGHHITVCNTDLTLEHRYDVAFFINAYINVIGHQLNFTLYIQFNKLNIKLDHFVETDNENVSLELS